MLLYAKKHALKNRRVTKNSKILKKNVLVIPEGFNGYIFVTPTNSK